MKIKKEYLLLGTNNFWYAVASSLKEAKELKRDILNDTSGQLFGDPESGHCPEKPTDVYIYEVVPAEDKMRITMRYNQVLADFMIRRFIDLIIEEKEMELNTKQSLIVKAKKIKI